MIAYRVDVSAEKIYWKAISASKAYASSGRSGRLDFSLKDDVLDGSAKQALVDLVSPEKNKAIGTHIAKVKEFFRVSTNYADPSDDKSIMALEI